MSNTLNPKEIMELNEMFNQQNINSGDTSNPLRYSRTKYTSKVSTEQNIVMYDFFVADDMQPEFEYHLYHFLKRVSVSFNQ